MSYLPRQFMRPASTAASSIPQSFASQFARQPGFPQSFVRPGSVPPSFASQQGYGGYTHPAFARSAATQPSFVSDSPPPPAPQPQSQPEPTSTAPPTASRYPRPGDDPESSPASTLPSWARVPGWKPRGQAQSANDPELEMDQQTRRNSMINSNIPPLVVPKAATATPQPTQATPAPTPRAALTPQQTFISQLLARQRAAAQQQSQFGGFGYGGLGPNGQLPSSYTERLGLGPNVRLASVPSQPATIPGLGGGTTTAASSSIWDRPAPAMPTALWERPETLGGMFTQYLRAKQTVAESQVREKGEQLTKLSTLASERSTALSSALSMSEQLTGITQQAMRDRDVIKVTKAIALSTQCMAELKTAVDEEKKVREAISTAEGQRYASTLRAKRFAEWAGEVESRSEAMSGEKAEKIWESEESPAAKRSQNGTVEPSPWDRYMESDDELPSQPTYTTQPTFSQPTYSQPTNPFIRTATPQPSFQTNPFLRQQQPGGSFFCPATTIPTSFASQFGQPQTTSYGGFPGVFGGTQTSRMGMPWGR
ncbi:hypothetical protein IAT38_007917 [Cryptococcus sp. DSM 104549]